MLRRIFLMSMFFPVCLLADVPSQQSKEVNHLISFVKNSNCILNRNGTDYTGTESVKHIKLKYDYFRDDIKNTEDFIKYSATKSTMSGKYYMVSCPGKQPVQTKAWLLEDLKEYRSNNSLINNASNIKQCTNPRPEICTMEYVPVCATLKNKKIKTYSTACTACSDSNVISYIAGGCPE